MNSTPLVSFIVLSYNYGHYLANAIQSILDQTVRELEIIVVDDASQDDSVEIARSFDDTRLRVLVNEANSGGVDTYNRALTVARGEWLANLDADDWIAPGKTEAQLAAAAEDPGLDIIGTYIHVVDDLGEPHPLRSEAEAAVNRSHDFGRLEEWIGQNLLARSSTMIRRSTHLRLGPALPGMVRAGDYEIWTRALGAGCRFGLVAKPLTYLRIHAANVSRGDAVGTFLELSYAMIRNLMPVAYERADASTAARMASWMLDNPSLLGLPETAAHRALGMLMTSRVPDGYTDFCAALTSPEGDAGLESAGWHLLALRSRWRLEAEAKAASLEQGIAWEQQQAQNWRDAHAWEQQQAQNWRDAHAWEQQQAQNWRDAYDQLLTASGWSESARDEGGSPGPFGTAR